MTALPLLERELRMAARQPSTYWSRFGFALFGSGAGAAMLYAPRRMGGSTSANLIVALWTLALFLYLPVPRSQADR